MRYSLSAEVMALRVGRPPSGYGTRVRSGDATRSTFGTWFRRWLPSYDPVAVERFWSRQGFTRTPVDMGWRFRTRADLEAVLRIEFPATLAAEFLASVEGCEVDYAVNLWWRHY